MSQMTNDGPVFRLMNAFIDAINAEVDAHDGELSERDTLMAMGNVLGSVMTQTNTVDDKECLETVVRTAMSKANIVRAFKGASGTLH